MHPHPDWWGLSTLRQVELEKAEERKIVEMKNENDEKLLMKMTKPFDHVDSWLVFDNNQCPLKQLESEQLAE